MTFLEKSNLEELGGYIKKLKSEFSEYSFANLYLFRNEHQYKIVWRNGFLFLSAVTYDGVKYYMPFHKLEEIGLATLDEIMADGYSIFPVSEADLHLFPENKYQHNYNPDDSDYIYTKGKIEEYPGRKLHKKRNLVKQYVTNYDYREYEYECSMYGEGVKVLDKWLELGEYTDIADTDYLQCKEALENCAIFGLQGLLYYADGKPSGFLLGEELSDRMFVIHFAKGVTEYKGIYPYMYTTLAKKLDAKYQLLNFEQDMGKDSLRQAKSTYIQDDMLHKYRVSLK